MNHAAALLVSSATASVLIGCASNPATPPQQPATAPIAATTTAATPQERVPHEAPSPGSQARPPSAGSKFSGLKAGMSTAEVNTTLGAPPTKFHTYESGKRWIPFYFGQDSIRLSAFYAGEGCLNFSVGYAYRNHTDDWQQVSGTLREVIADKSGECYKP